jgi:hypothetical protein
VRHRKRLRSAVLAFINGGSIQLSFFATQLNHELPSLSLCPLSRDRCARRSNTARRSVLKIPAVCAPVHAALSAASVAKPGDLTSVESVWTKGSRRPHVLFVSMEHSVRMSSSG